jgi:hypothetical protein
MTRGKGGVIFIFFFGYYIVVFLLISHSFFLLHHIQQKVKALLASGIYGNPIIRAILMANLSTDYPD